jgi:hypothetical protein
MRAYRWDRMKDWLLSGAIGTDEKMATDLAGPGYHINRSNLFVLESKVDMQKRDQASPRQRRRAGADLRAGRGAVETVIDPIASALWYLYPEHYESSGYTQIFRSTSPMGSSLR